MMCLEGELVLYNPWFGHAIKSLCPKRPWNKPILKFKSCYCSKILFGGGRYLNETSTGRLFRIKGSELVLSLKLTCNIVSVKHSFPFLKSAQPWQEEIFPHLS